MFASVSRFLRQIVPPVIATLIAALLIAGFNRAFMTHLTQPRMGGGLHTEASTEPLAQRPAPPVAAAQPPTPVVEYIDEPAPERLWEKGGVREAEKDQATVKLAETAPAAPPAPAAPRSAVRRPEPRTVEPRQAEPRQVEVRQVERRQIEPRHAEPTVMVAPMPMAVAAPAPVLVERPAQGPVVHGPPPVIVAAPPMVTVPDRPNRHPAEGAYAEHEVQPPRRDPFGAIVNTLKPSSLFARAREFGEKIEAAGNEILPSIRQ